MNSVPIKVYKCSECNQLYYTKPSADDCCKKNEKYYCKKCGIEVKSHQILCSECSEHERFIKAKKIRLESYKYDFIYDYLSEEYYSDIDCMIDHYEIEELEMPKYVYACKPIEYNLDISNAIEYSLEEHYEDAFDNLIDVQELYDFIEEWNKRQTVVSYEYDFSNVILL